MIEGGVRIQAKVKTTEGGVVVNQIPCIKDLECHFCGNTGHIRRYRFKWKNEKENHTSSVKHEKKGNDDNSNPVNITSSNYLLVVNDENLINLAYNGTNWVVDSGASFHVTFRRAFLTSYTLGDFGVVKIGNDGLSKVVGTETI